ncbi:MAG TPA: protein-L-isoaspartate(D-aspartate) O-methyltransferase [Arenibaculum sp.]|nr:protein-L-isoaspartate(D-aspartate) O-methyltransferase [Arenibaculum sp.]
MASTGHKAPVLVGSRRILIENIIRQVGDWRDRLGKGVLDSRALAALASVPRNEFIPRRLEELAYVDRPLDIGCGQTITQPSVVAVMTDLLEPRPTDRVLEIGTGCGYQTAVLSVLAGAVYTVEILPEVAADTALRLARLGYTNVAIRNGDRRHGWEQHAPFDAIILTAAPMVVPKSLLDQLKPGGRLVAPVGPSRPVPTDAVSGQRLGLMRMKISGGVTERRLLPVNFPPLTGGPAETPARLLRGGGEVIHIDPYRLRRR